MGFVFVCMCVPWFLMMGKVVSVCGNVCVGLLGVLFVWLWVSVSVFVCGCVWHCSYCVSLQVPSFFLICVGAFYFGFFFSRFFPRAFFSFVHFLSFSCLLIFS